MREPLAVDDEPTLVSPAADDTAIGREQAAALYAELAGLPVKQREAVVLRDLYGLRYDEVATALGTSRPAVEALLFRGRRRLQRRLRPGVAAGVVVVPLAVQESIAYAVPGFASTAVPTGAVAVAAGIPVVAKLAAGGAAVGLAGSAGIVAERSLHDPPVRPVETKVEQVAPARTNENAGPAAPGVLLPIPPGGFPVVRARGGEAGDDSGPGRGEEDEHAGGAAGDDEGDDDRNEDRADDTDGGEDERDEGEDRSGPDREGEHDEAADRADDDRSGPGGGDDSEDDHSGESGSSGRGGEAEEGDRSGEGSG
jgi:hypothetical protein